MVVICLLFAFVPLVTGQGTGEELCPNKTRDPILDAQWVRCVFYCYNGSGGWLTGYFPDGTWCYYDEEKNGTCYQGYCYEELPHDANIPSSTVSSKATKKGRNEKSGTTTEPTVTNGSTAAKSKDKQKNNERDAEKEKDKEKKKELKEKQKKKDEKGKEKNKDKGKGKENGKKTKKSETNPRTHEW